MSEYKKLMEICTKNDTSYQAGFAAGQSASAARIAELEADCKVMAESQVKLHRCTHSGEPEACLLDIGESCSYNNRFAGECPEFDKCTCPACTIAGKYREGKP